MSEEDFRTGSSRRICDYDSKSMETELAAPNRPVLSRSAPSDSVASSRTVPIEDKHIFLETVRGNLDPRQRELNGQGGDAYRNVG